MKEFLLVKGGRKSWIGEAEKYRGHCYALIRKPGATGFATARLIV
jgi:hypothetical protein